MSQNRNNELLFAQTLEKIKKLAKEQGNMLTKSQVEAVFNDIDIKGEQLEPIYQYLKAKNIGIGEPVDTEEKLSNEERDYLQDYISELKSIRRLSDGEKEAYIMRAMAGEDEAKDIILNHFLADVVDISKLYIGQGVLLEDLIEMVQSLL